MMEAMGREKGTGAVKGAWVWASPGEKKKGHHADQRRRK